MNKPQKKRRSIWRWPPFSTGKDLVTVLELGGVIGEGGPGRRGLTYDRIERAIETAFKPKGLTAVALSINSPGGSPVQSRMIHSAIRREAAKKNVPVLAFVEDVAASGGYILALAADEIYADSSSIVGSIGVIAATFGFQEAIARIGVERRVHTAGENKSQLDPFQPEDPDDVARLKTVLDDMHRQFIAMVKERRGTRLLQIDDIFTGAFWTAGSARERGLIDGTAHLGEFLRTRYGDDVRVKKVEPKKPSLLKRVLGEQAGALFDPDAAFSALEERAMWARYGR